PSSSRPRAATVARWLGRSSPRLVSWRCWDSPFDRWSVDRLMLRVAQLPATTTWRVAPYITLMKPRVISLLLVTTLAGMLVAATEMPPLTLVLATLLGGFLSAGG